jgi:hypothetical protein|uniref:Uncharacterized protein n=1 Tax=Desulfobacca acetoxidans TaxID=60893 RepID=A0A7C3WKZ3_9BACT
MRFLRTLFLAACLLGGGMTSVLSAPAADRAVSQAILKALGQELKAWTGLEAVFLVKYLQVKNGWAWVATFPQSPDGKSRYEPVEALLHQEAGAWKVLEIRPGGPDCEEDPDCADDSRYFRRLKSRFPQAPPEIFPH